MLTIDHQTKHVQLNTRNPDFYNNPYPTYHQLRAELPIFYWEDHDLWTFVRHADINRILRDRRFGRQITHVVSREALGWPPERPEIKPFLDVDRFSLLQLEPPDHTRLRGLVQKAFMGRQITRFQPRVAELAHQLIDQMEQDGPTDLLPAFATPIPVIIIAEMLGVPTDMANHLLHWSHTMVKMYELDHTAEQERQAVQAAEEFVAYLREYVAKRRLQPEDDLITQLIKVEESGEKLTEDELISTCILLLNAGHEATVNVIGNGVFALLKNPDQLERWRAHPTLAETAVNELLRYDTPLHLFNRWALEDVEFEGHQFKQGTEVSLILGAANRDPAQFDQPDRLDLGREPNPHLSLGGGVHYCLGAPLARLELQTALPILLERLPNLHLKSEPHYRDSYHFHGLEALQVGW